MEAHIFADIPDWTSSAIKQKPRFKFDNQDVISIVIHMKEINSKNEKWKGLISSTDEHFYDNSEQ